MVGKADIEKLVSIQLHVDPARTAEPRMKAIHELLWTPTTDHGASDLFLVDETEDLTVQAGIDAIGERHSCVNFSGHFPVLQGPDRGAAAERTVSGE